MGMRKNALIFVVAFIVALALCLQITAVSASQIVIEDADTIWNVTSEYSSDLTDITSNVTPRILAEYANSLYHNNLDISTDLTDVTSGAMPRILAEYANSMFSHKLDETPSELDELAGDVPPRRLIIDQAKSTWSASLVPPSFLKPRISIYTDKTSYTAGEEMYLGLDVKNPLDSAQGVSFDIYLETPMGRNLTLMDTTVTLPAELGYSNPNFKVIRLPSIPEGTYTWHAILEDPITGEIICEDTAEWEFIGIELPTEDITEVLEQTTVVIDFGEWVWRSNRKK